MRYLRAAAAITAVVLDAVAIVVGIVLSATLHFAWSLLAIGAASMLAVAALWQHKRTDRFIAASRVPRPPAIKPERRGEDPIDRHFTEIMGPFATWPHINPPPPPRTTQTGDHE